MADMSPNGRNIRAIAENLEQSTGQLAAIRSQIEHLDTRVGRLASAVAAPGQHKSPDAIDMPAEPCVVISDGAVMLVVTDRTCEQVGTWSRQVGPITRKVMIARLRSIADYIEQDNPRG